MKNKKILTILLAILSSAAIASCSSYNENISEEAQFSSSKNGVENFYYLLYEKDKDLTPLLEEENCYNVTTENLKKTGVSIFKFKDECVTYLKYGDDIYHFAGGFGGYGFVNAVTCDFDHNGKVDILYTYSYGSGIHRSIVSVFNLTTFEVTDLFSTFGDDAFDKDTYMSDLVLEKTILNNKPIYESYISELHFGDSSLVDSAREIKLAKTIDFSDYASNCSYSTKIGEA